MLLGGRSLWALFFLHQPGGIIPVFPPFGSLGVTRTSSHGPCWLGIPIVLVVQLMEEIRPTTWDVQNPVNHGGNYQPQLVSLPDFWTINSIKKYTRESLSTKYVQNIFRFINFIFICPDWSMEFYSKLYIVNKKGIMNISKWNLKKYRSLLLMVQKSHSQPPEMFKHLVNNGRFLNHQLGGGFKYFLFSTLPGEMIQFD